MSLESAIKDLTEAVKANTAALGGGKPATMKEAVVAAKAAEKSKAVQPDPAPSVATQEPTKNVTVADSGPVTYDTVKASLGVVINKFGKAAGMAVFEQFGIKDPKVDLAGDDKAELRAKVNKAMLARAAASE